MDLPARIGRLLLDNGKEKVNGLNGLNGLGNHLVSHRLAWIYRLSQHALTSGPIHVAVDVKRWIVQDVSGIAVGLVIVVVGIVIRILLVVVAGIALYVWIPIFF